MVFHSVAAQLLFKAQGPVTGRRCSFSAVQVTVALELERKVTALIFRFFFCDDISPLPFGLSFISLKTEQTSWRRDETCSKIQLTFFSSLYVGLSSFLSPTRQHIISCFKKHDYYINPETSNTWRKRTSATQVSFQWIQWLLYST